MEALRLERLLAEDRRWTYSAWEHRYLRRPPTGLLTRRLLWQYEVGGTWMTGVPADPSESPVGIDGAPLPIERGSQVRLWHPLMVEPEELARWRHDLPEHRFQQPFPQLFRRVYVAASASETHPFLSDRLAGYLLPGNEAVQFLRTREWRPRSLNPRWISRLDRELGVTGFRAEVFLTPAWDHHSMGDVRTATIRFRRRESGDRWRGVDLVAVPLLVFSEAHYDVGLFAETHAVGLDPRWGDENGASSQSSPRVRLDPGALLPVLTTLGIADRCTVSDRFLGVWGDRRSYRIDLATGDVVVEPDGRPLCLVPAPGAGSASDVLAFKEQDHLLSLVVSEALLLANDARIRDPSILRQLS
jgi:hypothetical protein